MAVKVLILCFLLVAFPLDGGCEEKIALIIIDVQNCFTLGGTLAVHEGDLTIPVINNLRRNYDDSYFDLVVLSQDWHCQDHVSFASVHDGYGVYSQVELKYNEKGDLCNLNNVTSRYAVPCNSYKYDFKQTLWPDHCVINTTDAEFNPKLTFKPTDVVVRKGYRCHVDSYSAFYDNGGFGQTELQSVLKKAGITTVLVTGLARDFCVHWTAKDAKQLGYKTFVVLDATRPVAAETGKVAVQDMKDKGIYVVDSSEVGDHLVQLKGGSVNLAQTVIFVIGMMLAVSAIQ